MQISILTLFPDMFQGPFSTSILKHAQEKNLITINLVNIRNYGIGSHLTVDDTAYGGGIGMVMRVDVLKAALDATRIPGMSPKEEKVVLMTADGKTFTQRTAESLSKLNHLIIICGHYEGVDERIKDYIDEEVSIGDFILTGGEIPAMLITDTITRLIPGVFKEGVTDSESFSFQDNNNYLLEYPHYTRPPVFDGKAVPEILLSGNHSEIAKWRLNQARSRTKVRRPDLMEDQS